MWNKRLSDGRMQRLDLPTSTINITLRPQTRSRHFARKRWKFDMMMEFLECHYRWEQS